MRQIRLVTLALAALLVPLGASAAVMGTHGVWKLGTLLAGIALNASAGTRTFTFTNPGGGYAKARFQMARTRVAGTDLTMTCTRTDSSGVAAKVQTCAWGDGDGICTHVDVTWKDTSSATETVTWELEVLGYFAATCIVASTSAGASDLLTVTGDLVAQ